jgi:hypothetical protein
LADNGELLISDGMFKLEVYDGSNNKLKLREDRAFVVTFPRGNDNNIMFEGIATTGKSNKVEWTEWDSVDVKRNFDETLVIGLDIFKYCNLDRFMGAGTLTDITVTVPPGFNNKNTECFLKYAGENASGYIPAKGSVKAFTTVGDNNGNKVVQDKAAKVICFAKKDGKFYYQIKTIAAIQANHTMAMDNMTETTEANLTNMIKTF